MARRLKLTILGAGGTIGKILSQDLAYRHDVYPATRDMCDLRDRNALYGFLKSRTDHVVINCAMSGGKQTLGAYDATELHDNLLAFHNLSSMQDKYRMLVNIGSGAEFDISMPITMAKESALTTVLPRDSYGMAMRLISGDRAPLISSTILACAACFLASGLASMNTMSPVWSSPPRAPVTCMRRAAETTGSDIICWYLA